MSLVLVVWSWTSGGALAAEPESAAPARDEPAWMAQAANSTAASSGHYQRATFRSLGALLLLIGALLAVNHWLRRRFVAGQPLTEASLKVSARLRLGVRQEVVVVEWGGDQLVLGVGPTFIQPLHIRRGNPADDEEVRVAEADHVQ